MRRDELANETEATHVTEPQLDIRYAAITHEDDATFISRLSPGHSDNVTSGLAPRDRTYTYYHSSENSTTAAEQRFYSSYDPEIGINTATVLGGLLLLLVIYVVYRTKCRKPILRVIQGLKMKYFPEEFLPEKKQSADVEKASIAAAAATAGEAEWISESAKMIWQERAKFSQESDFDKCCLSPEQRKCGEGGEGGEGGQCCEGNTCGNVNGELTGEACGVGNHLSLRLPETEEDIEKATAEWVQNVKHLDKKEQQLNGIILKIPPDLVSHTAKVRSYFNSVTDYCEADDFVSISSRNKSLPLLIEQQNFAQTYYANVNCIFRSGSDRRLDYAPLATQEDLDIDIDLDLDPRPSQLHVQHLSGSKVPLDICPIVKVQHFHSRSKRRLTSLTRTSSEESANSSEGSGSGIPQAVPTGQAKYIRLHTEEPLHNNDSHSDIKSPFQIKNNNSVGNNVGTRKDSSGKIETRL